MRITVQLFGGPDDGRLVEIDKPADVIESVCNVGIHTYRKDPDNDLKYVHDSACVRPKEAPTTGEEG